MLRPMPMNVLLLMSDQHRWDAMGCSADGSPTAQASWLARSKQVSTPHLDTFASGAQRFRQAVCNYPTCLPSRHSLITGLLPSQLGLLTNNDYWPDQLPVPTLGHQLSQAGYETASFGKMHWKSWGAAPEAVGDGRGFDTVMSFHDRVVDAPPARCYLNELDPGLRQQLEQESASLGEGEDAQGYVGLVSSIPAKDCFEAWLTDRLVEQLRERDSTKPFFYIWSVDRPHAPGIVPPEYADHYQADGLPLPPTMQACEDDDPGVQALESRRGYSTLTDAQRRTALARYLANMSFVDDCLGRIFTALDEQGLAEDTVVIYTSDHGELMGEHGAYTKYSLYDSAVRVPLLLRWPGMRSGGDVHDAPVELLDIGATILDAAGLAQAPWQQGQSLRKLCAGQSPESWRSASVTEFGTCPEWAVRSSRYKLIQRSRGQSALYDVCEDPSETINRIDDPTLAVQRDLLRMELLNRLSDSARRFPATAATKQRHEPAGIYDYCARAMP